MKKRNHRASRKAGIADPKFAPEWTREEMGILKACFATRPIAELRTRLPGRTTNAIRMRAAAMGLTRRQRWSVADVEKLEQLRNAGRTPEYVAKALGRTLSAVSQKCRQIDVAVELQKFMRNQRVEVRS